MAPTITLVEPIGKRSTSKALEAIQEQRRKLPDGLAPTSRQPSTRTNPNTSG